MWKRKAYFEVLPQQVEAHSHYTDTLYKRRLNTQGPDKIFTEKFVYHAARNSIQS